MLTTECYCPRNCDIFLYWYAVDGLELLFMTTLKYRQDTKKSADQTPPIQSDKYQCRKDTANFLLIIGTGMPETCTEEK